MTIDPSVHAAKKEELTVSSNTEGQGIIRDARGNTATVSGDGFTIAGPSGFLCEVTDTSLDEVGKLALSNLNIALDAGQPGNEAAGQDPNVKYSQAVPNILPNLCHKPSGYSK